MSWRSYIYLTTDFPNLATQYRDYGGDSVFWGGSMEVRVVRLLVKLVGVGVAIDGTAPQSDQ